MSIIYKKVADLEIGLRIGKMQQDTKHKDATMSIVIAHRTLLEHMFNLIVLMTIDGGLYPCVNLVTASVEGTLLQKVHQCGLRIQLLFFDNIRLIPQKVKCLSQRATIVFNVQQLPFYQYFHFIHSTVYSLIAFWICIFTIIIMNIENIFIQTYFLGNTTTVILTYLYDKIAIF